VFDRVDGSMSIARDEIFGPILCIQPFETEAEATSQANDTEYGLAATVWTADLGRGLRQARAIRAGHLNVRTGAEERPASGATLSHEPQKASGFGSETGIGGLQSYASLKFIRFSGG
jgi:acyl-CoA reductase-like NAD-dependent aldehyde dehydrogenase